MNTFILLGCIQLFRSDSKDIFVMLQINFLFIKESWTNAFSRNIKLHNCFQHW